MEGFTIIDGIVVVIIVLSALLAYGRGLVREAMAIAGWIGAAILAYLFAPQVQPLISEIPMIGEFVGDSCEISIIGAFAIVFVAALIIFSLFTPLFSSMIQRSALGGIDQALGFLFGVARGIVLVAVAFFVYSTVITDQDYTIVDESRSAQVFGEFTGQIEEQDPEQALGWLKAKYEQLTNVCAQ